MRFAFRSLLFVVSLRFRHAFAMPVDCNHHRRFGTSIDMLRYFRTVELARAVIQIGHPQIQAQTRIASEARNRADLSRQFFRLEASLTDG